VPATVRERFPRDGSTLERYARVFSCVEVNSTFYRPHRASTFARWAAAVPGDFRFALKVPKSISHVRRLRNCEDAIEVFLETTAALGAKRDVLLVQLPPKLEFDASVATAFFTGLRARYAGHVVCEPRHPSWFASDADEVLSMQRVARVAADPVIPGGSAEPGGWNGLRYLRLHGAPRTYWSAYAEEALAQLAHRLAPTEVPTWCIFDNTAAGAAAANALRLKDLTAAPS
jgi:uncharacterized protein YecE (DUF72 family)